MAEYLPNELWFLIFKYLQQIDILYSFNNLNKRFEQIILSYTTHIDLSHISYNLFQRFSQHIVPVQSGKIHSLILKNQFQLEFFNKNLFHLPTYLQCLTLDASDPDDYGTIDHDNDQDRSDVYDIISFNLQKLKFSSHLSDLRIYGSFRLDHMFENLTSCISRSGRLTHLTLVSSYCLSLEYYFNNRNNQIRQMSSIKSLTIHLPYLTDLIFIMPSVINIIELNLSIRDFNDENSKQIQQIKIPKSLNKLQFELGKSLSDWKRIKKFLSLFQQQLKSLVLIIGYSDDPQLVDFQSLYNNCCSQAPLLTTFQYLIRTIHCPSTNDFDKIEKLPDDTYEIYSKPRPVSLVGKQRLYRNNYQINSDDNFSLKELYNVTSLEIEEWLPLPFNIKELSSYSFTLSNLRCLEYYQSILSTDTSNTDNNIKLFSIIVKLAPNLLILNLNIKDSFQILELLKHVNIQLRKIRILKCNSEKKIHSSFLTDLVEQHSFRHIQHLHLHNIYPTIKHQDNKYLTPKSIIDQLRRYYKSVVNVNIDMIMRNEKDHQVYRDIEQWMQEQQDKSNFYCFSTDNFGFNVWL